MLGATECVIYSLVILSGAKRSRRIRNTKGNGFLHALRLVGMTKQFPIAVP